jgi:putative spermidine/putrescine transport system permease protein
MLSDQHSDQASWWLRIASGCSLLFLHFPILIIVLYSFTTETAAFTFPPPGLTTQWFGKILEREDFFDALWLSLQTALAATLVAVIMGTITALALYRANFWGKDGIALLIILPIALPGIVTGIALRSAMSVIKIDLTGIGINYQLDGIDFSIWTIIAGHATFCVVTVYNNVVARLRRTQYSQIEASMDLGASVWQTFRYIVLPNIASALLAGAMLSFALSFDEVVVTTFTAGQQQTLPIWIFSQLTRPRDRPVTNVAALVVIATTLIPILLAYRWSRASEGNL